MCACLFGLGGMRFWGMFGISDAIGGRVNCSFCMFRSLKDTHPIFLPPDPMFVGISYL